MTDLFLDLLTRSLSASILVLIVVLLRFTLKKAPKWMICALWVLVAIRLICPVEIFSSFSLIPPEISSGDAVGELEDIYSGTIMVIGDEQSTFQAAVDAGREPKYNGQFEGRDYYIVITAGDGVSEPVTLASKLRDCWLIGMTALAIYAAVSYLLVRRKVAASVGLRENICLCDYIDSPFILGIIRPRIYLPSSLDQSQWPHVIAHEKAHLHRKDHWWKPLGFAILCVYWFNPVLWLAYVLLCKDIELACDERVIRDMDTQQKKDYTTALLECSMPRYLIAACPLAFGEVGVEDRVKSVLNYKKPAFWIILIALVLCLATAVCFLTDPVGNSIITPGTYTIAETIHKTYGAWPYGMVMPTLSEGTYILQDDSLYFDGDSDIQYLGKMWEYNLDNDELRAYLELDPSWQSKRVHVATITDSMRLNTDNNYFYLWFQTADGNTYLAAGWSNRIAHICRLTRDEHEEEMELTWFDADILEARDTWLLVAPIAGSWEAEQYGEIEVSRWWHATSTDAFGNELAADGILPGEFSEGDRVRIVYDGQIQETYPARIAKAHSITKLSVQEPPPIDTDVAPAGLHFTATVLEVNDVSILIEPLADTKNHPGMDQIWVTRTPADSGKTVSGISAGDTVAIFYDGMIAETYPGQISTVYDIQILPQQSIDPTEPASPYEITVEVSNATATEALIVYHISNLGDAEIWTGYDYQLETLVGDTWVHYGYRTHQLAWEDALLFHVSDQDSENLQHTEVFLADWSRTSNAPLPSGTYRYCKDITIKSGSTTQTNTYYAAFTIPDGYPKNWGLHLEVLNPTSTGATLALTYNGGLIGELSTSGQYYMMINVGNDAMTKYGLVPSQVDWNDVSYPLLAGETVYLDVHWDHTADAPLPPGVYYVVLAVDHSIPYNGTESRFHQTKYITESFAITD